MIQKKMLLAFIVAHLFSSNSLLPWAHNGGILPYVFHDDGIWLLMGREVFAKSIGWTDFGGHSDGDEDTKITMQDKQTWEKLKPFTSKSSLKDWAIGAYVATKEGQEETMGIFTTDFTNPNFKAEEHRPVQDKKRQGINLFKTRIEKDPLCIGEPTQYIMFFVNVTDKVPTPSQRQPICKKMREIFEYLYPRCPHEGQPEEISRNTHRELPRDGADGEIIPLAEKDAFTWVEIQDFENAVNSTGNIASVFPENISMQIRSEIRSSMTSEKGKALLAELKNRYDARPYTKKYLSNTQALTKTEPLEELQKQLKDLMDNLAALQKKLIQLTKNLSMLTKNLDDLKPD